MTKKEICLQNKAIAYYSGFGGLEVHHIEYGIEDYMYCVSGASSNSKSYHKLKVYYTDDSGYIELHGCKIALDEFITISNIKPLKSL